MKRNKMKYHVALFFLLSTLWIGSAYAEKVYLSVPLKAQIGDWDCGPTSSAMVATAEMGIDITRQEIASRYRAMSGNFTVMGAHPRLLVLALESVLNMRVGINRFKVHFEENISFGRLRDILRANHPVILLFKFMDSVRGHYIAIRGFSLNEGDDMFYFNDPANGAEDYYRNKKFKPKFNWELSFTGATWRALGISPGTVIWIERR